MNQERVLVIGIGNEDCGDDGVGRFVCRKLAEKMLPQVTVMEHRGNGFSLMEAWEGYDWVIAVDAVSSGAQPGNIYHLESHNRPLPIDFFRCSTHDFGIAEAVEMARALGKLPARFTVYGVEGKNFNIGDGLSEGIENTVERVADQIAQEIQLSASARRKVHHA